MKQSFYSLDLNFTNFFDIQSKGFKKFSLSGLKQSIDQHLKLLFMSSEGEFRFDHEYGTVVSELDFSNEKQTGLYERMIEKSMADAIRRYEPRLKMVSIDVKFNRTGMHFVTTESSSFRLSIKFKVEAKLAETDEEYNNHFEIFFSPLSE